MESINRRARELLEAQTPGQLWEVMMRYGVTHVYIGRRPTELRADFFLADPAHFSPLYSADGVWVFQVNRRLQQGNTLESPTEGQLDL
jgi:hypothetical protein